MIDETGNYIQLGAAIVLATVFFVWANIADKKRVIGLLILLIPFQIISSRFGSLNVVLTYAVGLVFILDRRISYLPLAGLVGFILFSYFLSLSQIEKGTLTEHVIYIFSIGSNFVLFYLVYNTVYKINAEGTDFLWKTLITVNVLVLGYCSLQLIAGLAGVVSFGLEELTLNPVRDDHRLTGPFEATALTAEYLDIQILILFYTIMRENVATKRNLLWLLFALNCAFLITTGNRGGIVTLIIGLLVFLFLFRRELGQQAIVKYIFGGLLLFSVMAVVVVKYTEFNVLFERIENTEMDGFVPDSRSGWEYLLPIVLEKPIIGHGPRLQYSEGIYLANPHLQSFPYPHNLYMHLLYTVGGIGLLAYVLFFLSIYMRFLAASRYSINDVFLSGIPRLGIVILLMIAVSQFRIEMFRFITNDYQQFVFMLLGALLALTQLKKSANSSAEIFGDESCDVPGGKLSENNKDARILHTKNATSSRRVLNKSHSELHK